MLDIHKTTAKFWLVLALITLPACTQNSENLSGTGSGLSGENLTADMGTQGEIDCSTPEAAQNIQCHWVVSRYPDGQDPNSVWQFKYNEEGNLLGAELNSPSVEAKFALTYNKAGKITERYAESQALTHAQVSEVRHYDAQGRLESIIETTYAGGKLQFITESTVSHLDPDPNNPNMYNLFIDSKSKDANYQITDHFEFYFWLLDNGKNDKILYIIKDPSGAHKKFTWLHFTYDASERLEKQTWDYQDCGHTTTCDPFQPQYTDGYEIQVSYDQNGRRERTESYSGRNKTSAPKQFLICEYSYLPLDGLPRIGPEPYSTLQQNYINLKGQFTMAINQILNIAPHEAGAQVSCFDPAQAQYKNQNKFEYSRLKDHLANQTPL